MDTGRNGRNDGGPRRGLLRDGQTINKQNKTHSKKAAVAIKKAAQRLAKEDGVSLNQWIAVAVAETVGVAETAADFFKRRAGRATGQGLMRVLRRAPKSRPEPEDRHDSAGGVDRTP